VTAPVDGARRIDEGVWRILGPILLSIVLLGGGGWLAYVQAQIADMRSTLDEQKEAGSMLRERLRAVEVKADSIKESVDAVGGDARDAADNVRKLLEIMREERLTAEPKGGQR
jgi:hypothetical protein